MLLALLLACGQSADKPACRAYAEALQRCYNRAGQACPVCSGMCGPLGDTGITGVHDSGAYGLLDCKTAYLDAHVDECVDAEAVVATSRAAGEACDQSRARP